MPTRKSEFKPTRDNRRGKGKFYHRKLVCQFCADSSLAIDYKDVNTLRRFLTDRARIAPRKRTGACSKHQGAISIAIKRARHLALLPFSPNHEFPMTRFSSTANQVKPKEIDEKVGGQVSATETVTEEVTAESDVTTTEPTSTTETVTEEVTEESDVTTTEENNLNQDEASVKNSISEKVSNNPQVDPKEESKE
jgi:small subunit ribosomal protein S18